MSNFPFFGDAIEVTATKEDIPIYREVAWDYEKNKPVIENGDFKIVEGNEAVKSWCYRALQVTRYKYKIHTSDYGAEFENLISTQYSNIVTKAECTRYIKECLLINPYIRDVTNIECEFKGTLLSVNCNVVTLYSEFNINMGVSM